MKTLRLNELEAAELKELADFIAVRMSDHSTKMDETHFWNIIEQLDWRQEGNDEAVLASAIATLSHFPEADICAFADIQAKLLYQLEGKSYADAYAPNNYFSSDGFLYARCAVVANGRETYYRILEMPQDIGFESLLSLPELAWQLCTDKEEWDYLPAYNYETGFNEEGWGELAIRL